MKTGLKVFREIAMLWEGAWWGRGNAGGRNILL